MKEEWCECSGHQSCDFRKLTDFYSTHFIPTGWKLEYSTLLEREERRTLYITGKCSQCGGFMRSGVGITDNYTHDRLLQDICHAMLHYRPYALREDSGIYRGSVPQRLEWYWAQDQLAELKCVSQFTALFKKKDQAAARR